MVSSRRWKQAAAARNLRANVEKSTWQMENISRRNRHRRSEHNRSRRMLAWTAASAKCLSTSANATGMISQAEERSVG